MGASGCVWAHLGASGCIWPHLAASGCICVHLGASGCIRVHLGASGRICAVMVGILAGGWAGGRAGRLVRRAASSLQHLMKCFWVGNSVCFWLFLGVAVCIRVAMVGEWVGERLVRLMASLPQHLVQ